MEHVTLLYCHVKKGTKFKVGSLVGEHGHRADYITLENGDAVGVLRSWNGGLTRERLAQEDGITVLPPDHRPIKAEHAAAFAHVNATEGEPAIEVMYRLHETHNMPWLHPENRNL